MKIVKLSNAHYIVVDDETKKTYTINTSEAKELIGEVDVEKKADVDSKNHYVDQSDYWAVGVDSYIRGYNQALEDNKDKKYTEEDMIDFAIWKSITLFDQPNPLTPRGQFELWKSLQSKTEWEVEIIDGKLKLK